jgi:hypothetical protein
MCLTPYGTIASIVAIIFLKPNATKKSTGFGYNVLHGMQAYRLDLSPLHLLPELPSHLLDPAVGYF